MDNEPSTFEGFLYLLLAIITVIAVGAFIPWAQLALVVFFVLIVCPMLLFIATGIVLIPIYLYSGFCLGFIFIAFCMFNGRWQEDTWWAEMKYRYPEFRQECIEAMGKILHIQRFLCGNDYVCLMNQYKILKKEYERYHDVFPYIDEACKRNFRERDKTYYEFHELHHSYRDVVMVIMVNNLAEQVIITGEFHVWRGMLNPIGSEAYHLFHLLVDELEKSGYYTKEKAKEDRDWIRKMTQEAG